MMSGVVFSLAGYVSSGETISQVKMKRDIYNVIILVGKTSYY